MIKVHLTDCQIKKLKEGKITIQLIVDKKGEGFTDVLNQIKPVILEQLEPYINIPKILEILKNKDGSGLNRSDYPKIKKLALEQNGGLFSFFNILDKLKKEQPKVFGGFLPFLIPILTALGLGTASGVGSWGINKILNKVSGSGCKKKNLEGEFI